MIRRRRGRRTHVDDYNRIIRRKSFRYYEDVQNTLRRTDFWLTTRNFFHSEVIPILTDSIQIDPRYGRGTTHDILFEYLVVKAVTILELQLQHYCNIFIQKFPTKAELLLKDRDRTKNITIQILSNYTFSNLKDIHHVFSTLLGKDFFQVLRHRSEEYKSSIGYEMDHIRRASPLYKKWELFEELITLRNKLVHQNRRIRISSKVKRKNLLNTIYEVNYITSLEDSNLPYDEGSFSEIVPQY